MSNLTNNTKCKFCGLQLDIDYCSIACLTADERRKRNFDR